MKTPLRITLISIVILSIFIMFLARKYCYKRKQSDDKRKQSDGSTEYHEQKFYMGPFEMRSIIASPGYGRLGNQV